MINTFKTLTTTIAIAGLLLVAINAAQAQRVDFVVEQKVEQQSARAQSHTSSQGIILVAQSAKRVISPTQAVRAAMGSSPGGQALGVRYNAARGGYEVRIRVGGRLLKLFVNGRTGRVAR